MISSTIVVACRGVRRWFDLDAVRVENVRPDGGRYMNTALKASPTKGTRELGEAMNNNPNGSPPLDWHVDGGDALTREDGPASDHAMRTGADLARATSPRRIQLGEPPPDERDDPIALAVKIIDCMCPRQVCRVCGVPRERITDHQRTFDPDNTPHGKSAGALHSGGPMSWPYEVTRKTLGWTDCGHNAYRRGRVFDPYHNPVIEAACLILDRDYITS